jgi:hypothetical protein
MKVEDTEGTGKKGRKEESRGKGQLIQCDISASRSETTGSSSLTVMPNLAMHAVQAIRVYPASASLVRVRP